MKLPFSHRNGQEIVHLLASASTPLESSADLDPLMEYIGDSKYVLLGEASHGTHEYYTWRAKITQRLIKEKGFSFVAVEGDWPDCYLVNRYAKGYPDAHTDTKSVLYEFNRWPTWMWANWEMAAFIDWLKKFNKKLDKPDRVGFYGLDVYSFTDSMQAIIKYLKKNDPDALQLAYKVMECFEPYGKDEGQSYARASAFVPELCEKEVTALLAEINRKITHYKNDSDHEDVMSTEQNVYIARDAEEYYRAMIKNGPKSWNIRDTHMVATLDRLMKFHGDNAKTIVWEHNTHIGDARATDMAHEGMVNVGQLLREKFSKKGVVAVGFGSYKGSVIAGQHWGGQMKSVNVPNAIEGSFENSFHQACEGQNRLILLNKLKDENCLSHYIGHRAIGVVYHPEHEQYGNYVPTIIPQRYDAFIFLDKTNALHPLRIHPDGNLIPETYPFGM